MYSTYIIVVLLSLIAYFIGFRSCFSSETKFINNSFYNTKTPYRFVANYNDSTIPFNDCEPIRIIGIIRHGTRTPSSDDVRDMANMLPLIRNKFFITNQGSLLDDDKKKLLLWQYDADYSDEKLLCPEGEDEMVELSERLQNRFPSILKQNYSNKTFLFHSTDSQRSKESMKYFAIGLFGRNGIKEITYPPSLLKDPIIRFYKLCNKWRKEVKVSGRYKEPVKKYSRSSEVTETCEKISHKLGTNSTLSYDEVNLMYLACSFESAWYKTKKSPWCIPFSDQDLKVMEFTADLKHYWLDGYGFEINYKQACPLVKHIFDFLGNEKNELKSVFYFTHSGTLLKLISHFGLYKDDFVVAEDTPSRLKEFRLWRTSYIDAFGTNIIFVLHHCKNGEKKVLVLHQERIVQIPGCDSNFCSLSTLKNLFHSSLENCDFQGLCNNQQESDSETNSNSE